MKITKTQLKQIIKEEIAKVMHEDDSIELTQAGTVTVTKINACVSRMYPVSKPATTAAMQRSNETHDWLVNLFADSAGFTGPMSAEPKHHRVVNADNVTSTFNANPEKYGGKSDNFLWHALAILKKNEAGQCDDEFRNI